MFFAGAECSGHAAAGSASSQRTPDQPNWDRSAPGGHRQSMPVIITIGIHERRNHGDGDGLNARHSPQAVLQLIEIRLRGGGVYPWSLNPGSIDSTCS